MYSNNFGFNDEPFRLDLELKFLYKSPARESIDRRVNEHIREGQGILVLTSETGAGKTLALLDIVNGLQSEVKFIQFEPGKSRNFNDLIGRLCAELGLDTEGKTTAGNIHSLNDFLTENKQSHPRVALVVDDAQRIEDDVFNRLLLLSVPPSAENASLQIILAGSAGIQRKINQLEATLRHQFKIYKYRLENLDAAEVHGYITRRLHAVGYPGDELFTSGAISSVARHSDGVPRLINKICSSALFAADYEHKQKINKELVDRVARQWLLLTGDGDAKQLETSHVPPLLSPAQPSRNSAKYAAWGVAAFVFVGFGLVALAPGKIGLLTGSDPSITATEHNASQLSVQATKTSLGDFEAEANGNVRSPHRDETPSAPINAMAEASDQAMLTSRGAQEDGIADTGQSTRSSLSDNSGSRRSNAEATNLHQSQPGDTARGFIKSQENSAEAINLDAFFAEAEILSRQGQVMDAYLLYFYAAKRGHGDAAFRLARMADPATFEPRLSITGKPNLVQAKKWYGRAALAGHPEAKRAIDQFQTQVAAQAAQGDDQAREMMILLQ